MVEKARGRKAASLWADKRRGGTGLTCLSLGWARSEYCGVCGPCVTAKAATMDGRKAALRSLMKGAVAKREKRIESPFVRYNELDQAVCKVCDVVIKSEPLWGVHIAGRAHKEAVALLKVRLAAGQSSGSGKASTAAPPAAVVSSSPTSKSSGNARSASALPANFFEGPQKKHHRVTDNDGTRASTSIPLGKGVENLQKTASSSAGAGVEIRTANLTAASGPATAVTSSAGRGRVAASSVAARPDSAGTAQGGRGTTTTVAATARERVTNELPSGFFDHEVARQKQQFPAGGQQNGPAKAVPGWVGESLLGREDMAPASSALPEGFFDDVAADHKARGVEMKKVVIQDELKDFMTMIQRDVKDVELREEEEEYVAAEEREEREELERRSFLERMAALKKVKEKSRQLLEKLGNGENGTLGKGKTASGSSLESEENTDDEDEDDDDLLFDWRAKSL